MAMTNSGMSAAIKAAIVAEKGTPQDDTKLQEFCDAIGEAIVEYIQANAEVTVTGVMGGGGTAPGTIQ